MASGSFRDTSRALSSALSGSKSLDTLPSEVVRAIEAYHAKHEDVDDASSQRLHEELISIYNKHVANEPGRSSAFLEALVLFQPAIIGQNRVTEWWTLLLKPTLEGIDKTRIEISNAEKFVLDVLAYDADQDPDGQRASGSAHLSKLILGAYLKRTRITSPDADRKYHEDKLAADRLDSVLIEFGKKCPKEFLLAIDKLIVDKDYRLQALGLLSTFVSQQPPHLYIASQTPLIENILKCLMIDTSTTVIALALTTLIMFIPHIPGPVQKYLPRLFLIYSRLLCWERFSHSEADLEKTEGLDAAADTEQHADANDVEVDTEWEKLQYTFDSVESAMPELLYYFTFLYGMYPLNFMSYIRKPRRYLKAINFPHAGDFNLDSSAIQIRTEQFQRLHILHPNFYRMTVEDELADSRWLKCDPAEVVAQCISLGNVGLTGPKDDESASIPAIPDHPDAENRRPSVATLDLSAPAVNEKAHSPRLTLESSQSVHATNMSYLSSPKLGFGERQGRSASPLNASTLKRDTSIPSIQSTEESGSHLELILSPTKPKVPRTSSARAITPADANFAFLQRQLILLRNDLSFERYLKTQHLAHIGQLQRMRIREATIEAEMQNLLNANRILKTRVTQVNELYDNLKNQTSTWSSHYKRTEADMGNRLRTFRENETAWEEEERKLRDELSRLRSDCDQLRRLVVESESKELLSRRKLAVMTQEVDGVTKLHNKIEDLQAQIRDWQTRELDFERAQRSRAKLETELATSKSQMDFIRTGAEQARLGYDRRILELQTKLERAENPKAGERGQFAPVIERVIDDSVAMERLRLTRLTEMHESLLKRYEQLDARYRQLIRERNLGLHASLDEDDDTSSHAGSAGTASKSDLKHFSSSYPSKHADTLQELAPLQQPWTADGSSRFASSPESGRKTPSERRGSADAGVSSKRRGSETMSSRANLKGLSLRNEGRSSSNRSTSSQKDPGPKREESSSSDRKDNGKGRISGLRGIRGIM